MHEYIGKTLHGFCNGFFGRDSYDDKRIEVIGTDWVVVRNKENEPLFADFSSTTQMLEYLNEWVEVE